jgi:hypothetical protein
MMTGPLKQSPITTSLLPILMTSLVIMLYASSPPGTDCSTFSFPFVELLSWPIFFKQSSDVRTCLVEDQKLAWL